MRLVLALAALALPMPLLAQSTEPQPEASPTPETKKKDDANRRICRVEGKTGSRMGAVKVCLTRAQWEQRDEANRRDLRETEGNR
jgi:hypothetical protein